MRIGSRDWAACICIGYDTTDPWDSSVLDEDTPSRLRPYRCKFVQS